VKISDLQYKVQNLLDATPMVVHVSRMLLFTMDRINDDWEVAGMLRAGEFMIESVLSHRRVLGILQLHVKMDVLSYRSCLLG
jgi:hypothetical protein